MDKYYINQGEQINNNLNKGIDILNNDLKIKINNIKEELIKTNDTTAQSHIDKCISMTNKIDEEFLVKIIDECNIVTANAEKWQGWYDNLGAIQGDKGYGGAIADGLFAKEEKKTIQVNSTGFMDILGNIAAGFTASVNHGQNAPSAKTNITTKTISTYYWTSYSKVYIDSNGYIGIDISFYTQENNSSPTKTGGLTATVKNDADYDTYYNGRGSIGQR